MFEEGQPDNIGVLSMHTALHLGRPQLLIAMALLCSVLHVLQAPTDIAHLAAALIMLAG